MKVTYVDNVESNLKVSELNLENVGVNRFRVSIPIQDGAGRVVARMAEIEAASERTKSGTVRVMLKCTIPYFPQMLDEQGRTVIDSSKSPKQYTLHIVHTVPAIMANEVLNESLARQAAQVASIASQVISLGVVNAVQDTGSERIGSAPLQAAEAQSVDGVKPYPITDISKSNGIWTVYNVGRDALAGSFLGRALVGLMPIDINTDMVQPVARTAGMVPPRA